MPTFTFDTLKAKQRQERDNYPEGLSLRTHRALSWLQRAELDEDLDSQFLFLWISFNAAYAQEFHQRALYSEKRQFVSFFNTLINADTNKLLYKIVWNEFPKSIRSLLNNQYIFQPFWDYQTGLISEQEWKDKFNFSKAAANKALGRMNTKKALMVIFDRLYVLRNQMIHGGSTWNSGVNRNQLKEGVNLLRQIVPVIIYLMLENYNMMLGIPCYPVVGK